MLDRTETPQGTVVENVQLADIEDAVQIPPGMVIGGKFWGNVMWRSPEGHAEGPLSTPSDMFSFGLVVSEL